MNEKFHSEQDERRILLAAQLVGWLGAVGVIVALRALFHL